MTSIPTSRPAMPMARPGTPAPGSAAAAPIIDPLKLLKKYKWTFAGAAAAGMLLGIVSHFALLYTYPIFTPSMIYQCRPLEDDRGGGTPQAGMEEEFKRFMATQVQMMISDRIVSKTLSDPRLLREAPKWTSRFMIGTALDTTEAEKDLKKNLGAAIVGDSSFVRLTFWWTDKTEATAIVKLVGQAYQRDRQQENSGDVSDRRATLSRTVDEAGAQIARLAESRNRILQDQKVESLEAHQSEINRMIGNYEDELVKVRADRESYIVHRDKLQAELDSAPGITFSDSIRKRVEEDPAILRLKQTVNELEASLIAKRKQLAEGHRTIVQLRDYVEGMKQQLQIERERIMRQYFDSDLEQMKTGVASQDAQEAVLLKKLEQAKQRANELTTTMAQVKDLDKQIDRETETRARIQENLKRFELSPVTRVMLYQDAQIPKGASFPQLKILLPLGVFLVVGLVAGVVVLIEVVDQRVKGPACVAMIPRTRLMGMVPHASEDPGVPQRVETVFRDLPGGVLAESYRQLRGAVIKKMQQEGHKSLLVMSGMPGSGATTAVSNLAWALASADQRVLVIDANFRRPSLHRIFDAQEGPGLADVLDGSASLTSAVQATADARLHVLSAGSADKRLYERLTTEPMAEVLREARERFDIILVDVAPAMVAGDALALANRCDASLLVVRALGEKRGMVARLRNELSDSKAEFLGVLVNAVRSAAGGYLKGNILASHNYQNPRP